MVLLGCEMEERNTEQHDITFAVGETIKDIVPTLKNFWKDYVPIKLTAWRISLLRTFGFGDIDLYERKENPKLHIDVWRTVTRVGKHTVHIEKNTGSEVNQANDLKLFFINFGGYTLIDFEEFHKKLLIVAKDLTEAHDIAFKNPFYITNRNDEFKKKKALPHIDDEYIIDGKFKIDNIIDIGERLPGFRIMIFEAHNDVAEDTINPGYLVFSKLEKSELTES